MSRVATTTLELLRRTEYYASRSTMMRHKTGAVITNFDNGIVSEGWSHYSQLRLANYRSIHAEVSAIIRCGRKEWLNSGTIYIVTLRKSGNHGMARPCEHCLAILHEVGIKQVVYTTGADNFYYERLLLK